MPYGKPESDILYTRSIKAGKRVYYVDVKQDRNQEYYIALTESKRIKDGTPETPPQFEKHKIFLYREDIERFRDALDQAIAFAEHEAALHPAPVREYYRHDAAESSYRETPEAPSFGGFDKGSEFNIEF